MCIVIPTCAAVMCYRMPTGNFKGVMYTTNMALNLYFTQTQAGFCKRNGTYVSNGCIMINHFFSLIQTHLGIYKILVLMESFLWNPHALTIFTIDDNIIFIYKVSQSPSWFLFFIFLASI